MGMMDMMKDAMDTVRKIDLKEPLELDALFEILKADAGVLAVAEPTLKKGLLGKSIGFPKVSRAIPRLTVKGNTVTIRKIVDNSGSAVSVGGVSFRLDKDMRGTNAINTVEDGSAYFKAVCDAVEAALQGK